MSTLWFKVIDTDTSHESPWMRLPLEATMSEAQPEVTPAPAAPAAPAPKHPAFEDVKNALDKVVELAVKTSDNPMLVPVVNDLRTLIEVALEKFVL